MSSADRLKYNHDFVRPRGTITAVTRPSGWRSMSMTRASSSLTLAQPRPWPYPPPPRPGGFAGVVHHEGAQRTSSPTRYPSRRVSARRVRRASPRCPRNAGRDATTRPARSPPRARGGREALGEVDTESISVSRYPAAIRSSMVSTSASASSDQPVASPPAAMGPDVARRARLLQRQGEPPDAHANVGRRGLSRPV